MWDRALFSLRRFGLELGPRLGSWRLSVVLMPVLALYYLFLAIWARSSPPEIVQDIALLLPFWLVYLLLLVNTAVCLWRRLPMLRRDVSPARRWQGQAPHWQLDVPGAGHLPAARILLRRLGYRVLQEDGGGAWGIRQRWAALGTYLFHGAFFLLAVGFSLTLLGRQETRIRVAEGESYAALEEQIVSRTAPGLLPSTTSHPHFELEAIQPVFWRDELLFTDLRADLVREGGRQQSTWINSPLWLGGTTFLRLAGFGYTPRYELLDRDGLVLDTAFVKLNVFPPGQRDHFSPDEFPHRIYVEILPDLERTPEGPVTASLNLNRPGYRIQVYRGRVDLGGGLLEAGETFAFEGMSLRFPEVRYWGEFSIVRDPGVPLVMSGFMVGLAGLLLKLRGVRQEIVWKAPEGGQLARLHGWGGRPPRLPRRQLSQGNT